MTETCLVELWEFEELDRSKSWVPDSQHPWTTTCFEDSRPPDELTLPSPEWCWSSNWKIDKKTGATDGDGWEYATNFGRFKQLDRSPKVEKKWNDKSRRRMWSRAMRKDGLSNGRSTSTDLSKTLPRIQQGLSSIYKARLRIEAIMKEAPDAVNSEQMQSTVKIVKKNISDIMTALEQAETQQQKQPGAAAQTAVIKKLKNDLAKEEMAIERALDPTLDSRKGKQKTSDPSPKINGRREGLNNGNNNNSNNNKPSADNNKRPELKRGESVVSKRNPFADSTDDNNNTNATATATATATAAAGAVKPTEPLGPSKSSRSSVTGGNAKAFNPSAIASSTGSRGIFFGAGSSNSSLESDNWTAPEDGVFVDRTMQERLIEQKLRPIDEATVMQEIIDERSAEITKIYRGITEVNEMFRDLSEIVREQQVNIDKIFDNADTSHAKTKDAFKHIVAADQLQRSGNCVLS